MAMRDLKKRRELFQLISVITLFFTYSFLYWLSSSRDKQRLKTNLKSESCDYSTGVWRHDRSWSKRRYESSCKEIFSSWNCISNGKSNAKHLLEWRWQPNGCDLPRFDPLGFLQKYKNRNIGFVGDSLSRNMFISLFCTLNMVSRSVKKWRPAGADRGFTFVEYNLTIAYHRTNLLVHYHKWYAADVSGTLESLGYKEGYRVDIDIPEKTWAIAPSFHDVLILNTGHWWFAHSKFDPLHSPLLFFENGQPLTPPVQPGLGLEMALKHMISFVERTMRAGGIKLFCTSSPRHFEGGDWNRGGHCTRKWPLSPKQVEELFAVEKNGTNIEAPLINQYLYAAVKGSRFQLLDITRMSEFRADAHPSDTGGKKHNDCMHWCLPGVTDTWNDLFIAHLNRLKPSN